MSDQILRTNLIRLASEKPEIRAYLLPLLKKADQIDTNLEDYKLPLALCTQEYRLIDMKVSTFVGNPNPPQDASNVRDLMHEAGFKFLGWKNGVGIAKKGRITLMVSEKGLSGRCVALCLHGSKSLSGSFDEDSLTYAVATHLMRMNYLPKDFSVEEYFGW